jgi:monolysocardiolipin acyltransferase
VDRRWLWRRPDGRVATEAVRRWSDRVRTLLQRDRAADQSSTSTETTIGAAAKPSSSALRFYRKKVGKEVDGIEDSVIFRSFQALAVPLIGNACYVFMHGLNSVQIYGAEKLHQALQERPKGKPLLTVSNHVAAMDDPFVIASLLPPSVMLEAQKLRWTLCATDRCFTNPVLSTFFRSVKVLPVSRGDGIYQKGMDMALSKLNSGGWVHIFPEGSRSKDGGKTIAPSKRGVGRLVMDADSLPVVIPFVHTGMQDIMPVGKRIPRAGKQVIVVVGDPINFDDLIIDNSDDTQHLSRGILYDKATQRIGQRLQELKVEVDRLASEQQSELQNHHIQNVSDDGYRLWQQVDWEGFGIGSSMLPSEPSFVQEQSKEAEPEPPLEVEQSLSPAPSAAISFNVPHWFQRHVDPSELMGFAARGLIKNGKFLEECYRELQEPATLNSWWRSQACNAVPRWSTA